MDWILGGTIGQSHYGASISNSRVTDLVFSDNAVILAESQGLCVGSLATAQGCDSIGNPSLQGQDQGSDIWMLTG